MKVLYGTGFSQDEIDTMRCVVYSNTIQGTRILLENCTRLGYDKDMLEENKNKMESFLTEVMDDEDIDAEIAKTIKNFWEDPGIQKTYDDRAEFQLFDSFDYYANMVTKIGASDYTPSTDDILRSRVRTSGIVEERYTIEQVEFRMYDVGGQRNERKKWIHCFENVTAVIFVAAISEYDQVLYEDSTTNRIIEAVNLFEEICNSRWFLETSMILFLNKADLFEMKIAKGVPIKIAEGPKTRNEDYDGAPDDIERGKEYMKEKFVSRNLSETKEVYDHVTCATNTENVAVVFNSCKDTILKANLRGSGFMD
jgi:hypothetical protein